MPQRSLPKDHHATLFSLDSGRELLDRICNHLGVSPGRHEERDFEDGEHKIRPLESVRGRDVYVIESLYSHDHLPVDEKVLRLLFFVAALRDAGAARITAVTPYLCYARKDRRTKPRDPVTIRYLAGLFESVGIDRIITVDVHNPSAYENAFRIPAEHLTAAPMFVEAISDRLKTREPVVVSPDAGGEKRADRFRQILQERLDRPVDLAYIEKFRSEGVVRGGAVVGEVENRTAIILDDLISSGGTLARAASACRSHGAQAVYAAATHGVFSAKAGETLDEADLEHIFITDTIPPARLDDDLLDRRFDVIDCAPLLASTIRRLHLNDSILEYTDTPPS